MPSSKGIYDILQEFTYLFFKSVKALAINPHLEHLTKERVEQTLALTKIRNSCNSFQYKEPWIISIMVQGIEYLYH